MKKGFLASLGKKVNTALEAADDAVSNAGDKLKEAVKGDETHYISETFDNMDHLAEALNELEETGAYKSFKVLGVTADDDKKVDALLYVTKK